MPGVTLPLCLFSHDITPVNMALEAVSPLVCIVVVVRTLANTISQAL